MKKLHALIGAWLLAASAGAQAQSFSLEGAVIDSRDSRSLGVISERGDLAALFRAQKTMTFGILRAAGISLDQLPPEVRARVERFATTNLDAFRAFSEGLDLKDQGRFVEAKERFRRAAELDPGFALATEQQQAMPDVNLGSAATRSAVIAAAVGAALDKGKTAVVVDAQQAAAALSAGAKVVLVKVEPSADPSKPVPYNVNDTGQGDRPQARLVAGYAYTQRIGAVLEANVANAQEWRTGTYSTNGDVLERLGPTSDGFQALRGGASHAPGGRAELTDGSFAYWGAWASAPNASATVSAGGVPVRAPELGRFDYVFGTATVQMPGTGTATYTATPGAGSLGVNAGSIQVNFAQKEVAVQNLGLSLGGLNFSGLNGRTSYGDSSAAGTFSGRYSSGLCDRCTAFVATASTFNGSFIGRNADGLVFSSILVTGNPEAVTRAGVQLLTRQGP
jgi:hypothetical protein